MFFYKTSALITKLADEEGFIKKDKINEVYVVLNKIGKMP